MTALRRSVGSFAAAHRGALTVVGSLGAIVVLGFVLAGRWNEFAAALTGAPLAILALAAAMQLASLLTRSESWLVCVRAAGPRPPFLSVPEPDLMTRPRSVLAAQLSLPYPEAQLEHRVIRSAGPTAPVMGLVAVSPLPPRRQYHASR